MSDGHLTLHLVRHGETTASRERRFCGVHDCALSDRGRWQMERVVERLSATDHWREVHTSPLRRCLLLAESAGRGLDVPVVVEDGLSEIDHGSWDGRLEDDVAREEPDAYRAYQAHPATAAAPGGENGYEVAARALPVVRRIQQERAEGHVLLVSHKATLRIIVCALLGVDIDRYRDRLAIPEASITTIEFEESGPLLLGFADVSHLAGYTAPGPPDERKR